MAMTEPHEEAVKEAMPLMQSAEPSALEAMELELLLNALHSRYGYDFRHYCRDSLWRRVKLRLEREGVEHISELIPLVMRDAVLGQRLIMDFSITVTQFFRDPDVFLALRRSVFPLLRTFPFFKIWHAGCATGEEVYSLAILLHEEGLLERALIYGTDINAGAINTATRGVYSTEQLDKALASYRQAGGQGDLDSYFHRRYGRVKAASFLSDRLTFSLHNLVSDGTFGEMQLILCRNVLIYFDQRLKEKTLQLFARSLYHKGFLCLGRQEHLVPGQQPFEAVDKTLRLYQKSDASSLTAPVAAVVAGISG
ncbi:protein-glutamate O-methyltransferase CheR [Gallaecimonas sp. GXIMD4217]|uniref:CheR family methyltransferase n=1 Tax=Gallaecimonas sp. GXIMD4217 TaxID=3131927 RepID=UPI00311AF766